MALHGYRAEHAFDGERVVPDGALVLVDEGRIEAVLPRGTPAPHGCHVVDAGDATVLPGLINCHVHLCADSGPRALDQLGELDDAQLDAIVANSLREQLAAGVTTVRDLGDVNYALLGRSLLSTGPTIVLSGPPITTVGGHCAVMGGAVSGDAELVAAVRERADRGVDIVKIMTSGGVMTVGTDPAACQFTLEELRLVVEEAHRVGLPVTGHAHALGAIEMCVDAGVDGIEHCTCVTPTGLHTPPELVERLAAAGTVVCPTLGYLEGVEMPPQVKATMAAIGMTIEGRRVEVGKLVSGGVTIVSGGDDGINPGKAHGVLRESVAALAAAGASTSAALASATSAAAEAIGLGARKGRLRAAFDADLLIVAGDATADVAALRDVHTVVCGGEVA